jgi:hypothetical protein
MLFRPVYGPELEVIYNLIAQSQTPLSRPMIYQACLPAFFDGRPVSPQSIDDALSFLVAAWLIEDRNGFKAIAPERNQSSFRLTLISHMQSLARGEIVPLHDLDALYFLLLEEMFIRPDRLYVEDVHTEANKLRPVMEMGGISKEKIRSWKRVMAFLGIGQRIADGFCCVYDPTLLQEIIDAWRAREGFIQDLLETHVMNYLPLQTETGALAQAVGQPLLFLQKQQIIHMSAYQDASSKSYFADQRLRYLVYRGDDHEQ